MSAALDWVREARASVAAAEGGDPEGWQIEVSSCCGALVLMWYSTALGGSGLSCTACQKSCSMVSFDPLSEELVPA